MRVGSSRFGDAAMRMKRSAANSARRRRGVVGQRFHGRRLFSAALQMDGCGKAHQEWDGQTAPKSSPTHAGRLSPISRQRACGFAQSLRPLAGVSAVPRDIIRALVSQITTVDRTAWDAGDASPGLMPALERGDVLFLPALAFDVAPSELRLFSPDLVGAAKNVSFDPRSGRLGGTSLDGADRTCLRDLLARFSVSCVDAGRPRAARISRSPRARPHELSSRRDCRARELVAQGRHPAARRQFSGDPGARQTDLCECSAT